MIANVKQIKKQITLHKMVEMVSLIKSMIAVASTFSNNSLSELHVKYFSWNSLDCSRICLTVKEHLHLSQSGWLLPTG